MPGAYPALARRAQSNVRSTGRASSGTNPYAPTAVSQQQQQQSSVPEAAEQPAAPVQAEPVVGDVKNIPVEDATSTAEVNQMRSEQSFFPSGGPDVPVEVRIGNGSWKKVKSFKLLLPQGSGVAAYLSDDMWSDQGVVWIKKFETDTDIRKTRGSSMMSSPRADRLDLIGCVTKRGSEPEAGSKCDTKVSIAFSNADDYETFLDKIKASVVAEGGKRSSKRRSTRKRKSTKKRGGKKRTAKRHGAKRSRTRKARRHGKRRTKKH